MEVSCSMVLTNKTNNHVAFKEQRTMNARGIQNNEGMVNPSHKVEANTRGKQGVFGQAAQEAERAKFIVEKAEQDKRRAIIRSDCYQVHCRFSTLV